MVSIVVPVYRSEDTLERCVHSLCSQTYEDIEVILVVDGPPDRSGILAGELAKEDNRIKVVYQENQGVSVSRNRGIQEATGEYIRFVDSDDYVEADSIECMVKAMEENDTDFVIAGYHHHYFGRNITKLPKWEGTFNTKESREKVFGLYMTGFLNMPWNKLYRKADIQEGFPTDLNLGEDLCFNLAYLKDTKHFTLLKETVCEYIQDDRGTTLSTKRRMDKIPIAFRLYETVKAVFEQMYPGFLKENDCLETKLLVEFLDDMEGLAFDKEMKRAQKLDVIQSYEEAYNRLTVEKSALKPDLQLLDYKVIFFCFKRKWTALTLIMVELRGFVAKVLKKR